MPVRQAPISRRSWLRGGLIAAAAAATPATWLRATPLPLQRPIHSSDEVIPAVGLGSWITFNVGTDPLLRDECAQVIEAFYAYGGRLIDSSPMYGSSQAVIGHGLRKLGISERIFAADKVWTGDGEEGASQIEQSRRHWSVPSFSLLQVHNLWNWQAHLRTLFAMKEAGTLRYVGITTSEGRRHDEFARIMRREPIDFVQFSYNVLDREAERELLPLAQERGIAVIINRPFRQDELTRRMADVPLPAWARELNCTSWAGVMLKFILAHPAVTCAIPATTQVAHAQENMLAAQYPLPDSELRRRIIAAVEARYG